MDNFTHALSGLVLNGLIPRSTDQGDGDTSPETSKARLLTIFVASQLPDVDIVTRLWGELEYLAYHRGPTHSLIGAALLTLLLAGGMKIFFPQVKTLSLFLWGMLAALLHLALDLLTAYGTQVFYPWDLTRYAWDSLMIIDPILLLLLGLGLAGGRWLRSRMSPSRTLVVFAVLAIAYVGGRVGVHSYLTCQAAGYIGHERLTTDYKVSVLPPLVGLREWDLVIETPQEFLLGSAALGEKPSIEKRLRKPVLNPNLEAALESSPAMVFLDFARYPYVVGSVFEGGYRVYIIDLRYYYGGRIPFSMQIDLDRDLNLKAFAMGKRAPTFMI